MNILVLPRKHIADLLAKAPGPTRVGLSLAWAFSSSLPAGPQPTTELSWEVSTPFTSRVDSPGVTILKLPPLGPVFCLGASGAVFRAWDAEAIGQVVCNPGPASASLCQ